MMDRAPGDLGVITGAAPSSPSGASILGRFTGESPETKVDQSRSPKSDRAARAAAKRASRRLAPSCSAASTARSRTVLAARLRSSSRRAFSSTAFVA